MLKVYHFPAGESIYITNETTLRFYLFRSSQLSHAHTISNPNVDKGHTKLPTWLERIIC